MRTIETTVYQYAELSDKAKDRARDWYREASAGDDIDTSDAETIGAILGIEFDTRPIKLMGGGTRQEPCIYYHLAYCQGDGAAFAGTYRYAKGAAKRVREYAPTDTALHRIADALQAVQARAFYRLVARCESQYRGGMSVDVTDSRDPYLCVTTSAEHDLTDTMREFADWIYQQVKSEHEYQTSDETVAENIIANEYEFTAEGARHD